ncbi:MAG: hypothetical protein GWP70_02350 [Proteobacteria bacterium]|nr:hypothetical protein [Pseudomonadota bacterium]
MATVETTDVLIVGAGPTGLCASLLLSQQGISHIVVERKAGVLQAPAAHVINTRTMEIFAQLGLPVAELYALNRHPNAHKISWLAALQSPVLGEFDLLGNPQSLAQMMSSSNQRTTNISQHLLERYLLKKARNSDCASIRYSTQWLGFVDEAKQISSLAQNGKQASLQINAKYLLAADGAGSPIANALNIRREGPEAIATFINFSCAVDITKARPSTDEVRPIEANLLLWLLDPDLLGTVIVHDPKELSVFMKLVPNDTASADLYSDEETQALLTKALGADYKLLHKGLWRMTAQVAERFRHQHIFLVGDAAHRFPPTGGLGLNTGVGDVHNLIWKIKTCLRDPQQSALLDTYEQERKPIAQRSCDVSVNNNAKMEEVLHALGLDPSKAPLLQKIMSWNVIRMLPKSAQDRLRGFLVAPVRKRLAQAAADDKQGQSVRERTAQAIAGQEEHFNTIGLQLGSVYEPNLAIAESSAPVCQPEVSNFVAKACVGVRLPHVALSLPGGKTSTLDLLNYSSYTLITNGPSSKSPDAMPVFQQPLNVLRLDAAPLDPYRAGIEAAFELAAGDWLLLRPDGVIADRSQIGA